MKKAQLTAVIVIVLLVAAVGGFIIFSDKRAGEATRALKTAYQQPPVQAPQAYVPPGGIAGARPPTEPLPGTVPCDGECRSDADCAPQCSKCSMYFQGYATLIGHCMTPAGAEKAAAEVKAASDDYEKRSRDCGIICRPKFDDCWKVEEKKCLDKIAPDVFDLMEACDKCANVPEAEKAACDASCKAKNAALKKKIADCDAESLDKCMAVYFECFEVCMKR